MPIGGAIVGVELRRFLEPGDFVRKCYTPIPNDTELVRMERISDRLIDFYYRTRWPAGLLTPARTENWVCRRTVATVTEPNSIPVDRTDVPPEPGEPLGARIADFLGIGAAEKSGLGGFLEDLSGTAKLILLGGLALVVGLAVLQAVRR